MYNVRTHSLGKAHELILKSILKHGELVFTEDSEKTIELPEPSNIHVKNPFNLDMVSEFNMFGEKAMQQYVNDLLNGCDKDFVYTYHDRLFKYPNNYRSKYGDGGGSSDGKNNTINQISSSIVNRLLSEPLSRRAQGITWFPNEDIESKTPPCLQRIQCTLRKRRLNMYVEFRSNDMLSALGANMYALAYLQGSIADQLGVDVGWYSHTSVSPHIYYERDYEELMKYVNGLKMEKIYESSNIFG